MPLVAAASGLAGRRAGTSAPWPTRSRTYLFVEPVWRVRDLDAGKNI